MHPPPAWLPIATALLTGVARAGAAPALLAVADSCGLAMFGAALTWRCGLSSGMYSLAGDGSMETALLGVPLATLPGVVSCSLTSSCMDLACMDAASMRRIASGVTSTLASPSDSPHPAPHVDPCPTTGLAENIGAGMLVSDAACLGLDTGVAPRCALSTGAAPESDCVGCKSCCTRELRVVLASLRELCRLCTSGCSASMLRRAAAMPAWVPGARGLGPWGCVLLQRASRSCSTRVAARCSCAACDSCDILTGAGADGCCMVL